MLKQIVAGFASRFHIPESRQEVKLKMRILNG